MGNTLPLRTLTREQWASTTLTREQWERHSASTHIDTGAMGNTLPLHTLTRVAGRVFPTLLPCQCETLCRGQSVSHCSRVNVGRGRVFPIAPMGNTLSTHIVGSNGKHCASTHIDTGAMANTCLTHIDTGAGSECFHIDTGAMGNTLPVRTLMGSNGRHSASSPTAPVSMCVEAECLPLLPCQCG